MAEIMTWADLMTAPPILLSGCVELAAENMYGVVDISPHTVRWFRSSVISLVGVIGDIEITAVNVAHVAEWQEAQIKKGTAAVTANSYLRGLKTLFGRLLKSGRIDCNPAQPAKPLPESQPSPKAIDELDYLLMREVADSVRDVAILDTLWGTGCRLQEIIGMNVNKVETWDNGRAAAIEVTGKLKKKRWVYWKGDQAESLGIWLRERPASKSHALFTTSVQHKRFTDNGFSSLIRIIRTNAGVLENHTNPHAFRHAFAIRKLDEGYDLAAVSQWLGHSSPEFTAKVYCVRTENELRKRFFSEP